MPNLSVQGLQLSLALLGVLCLLGAIVGGGFKIFGVELPEIKSKPTKVILCVFGVVLIAVPAIWALWPPRKPIADGNGETTLNFTGANFLAHPAGLAVDNKGTLYVADHDNNRVLTLTPDSTTPNQIQQFAGTNTLRWPAGVAVDNRGTLYVADSLNNRVLKLAAGSDTPTEMKEFTGPQYGLDGPLAVAVDNSFNVYVADTNHRRVLELAAGSTTPIELAFNSPHLLTPAGVAVDSSLHVYVTDVDAKCVYKLVPNKVSAQQIPVFSYAGLMGPSGVAVDSHDNVYVTDVTNQVLELAAGSTTATPLAFTSTKLAGPTGVAVDSSFNVYVANWGNGLVLKLPRK